MFIQHQCQVKVQHLKSFPLFPQSKVQKRRQVSEGKAGEDWTESTCWETQSCQRHVTHISSRRWLNKHRPLHSYSIYWVCVNTREPKDLELTQRNKHSIPPSAKTQDHNIFLTRETTLQCKFTSEMSFSFTVNTTQVWPQCVNLYRSWPPRLVSINCKTGAAQGQRHWVWIEQEEKPCDLLN